MSAGNAGEGRTVLSERALRDGEDPPDSDTGYVACRGCGWYGDEGDTIWTNNERVESDGYGEMDALSCPECHSSDLRDAFEPATPTEAP